MLTTRGDRCFGWRHQSEHRPAPMVDHKSLSPSHAVDELGERRFGFGDSKLPNVGRVDRM